MKKNVKLNTLLGAALATAISGGAFYYQTVIVERRADSAELQRQYSFPQIALLEELIEKEKDIQNGWSSSHLWNKEERHDVLLASVRQVDEYSRALGAIQNPEAQELKVTLTQDRREAAAYAGAGVICSLLCAGAFYLREVVRKRID